MTLVGMPCKNPVFWSLDAKTGEFFYARETFRGAQNLYDKIDPVTGLATMNQAVVYDRPGKKISYCTSHSGGRDGHVAPAYDPKRNIMIQATGNICATGSARDNRRPTPAFTYNVDERQVENPNVAPMEDGQYPVGRITAVDVATGNTVWQYLQRPYNYSAVLATAGGLVFNGDAARYFFALDIDTGKKVWESPAGLHVLRLPGQLLRGRAAVYRRRRRLWPKQPGSGDRRRRGSEHDLRVRASEIGRRPLIRTRTLGRALSAEHAVQLDRVESQQIGLATPQRWEALC